ncbi:MAG: AsmA family protein [bacterium]|nr:AsmA family protein [bacterium]
MKKKLRIRRKPVYWTGGILAGIAAALALFIAFFPIDYVRAKISGTAGSRFGRDVVVEGPLTIDWHWRTPHVTAEKIRVSNIKGAKDADMASADRIEFSFRLWPLLLGRLEIPSLEIDHPVVNLERTKDGVKNWNFSNATEAGVVVNAALPDDRHDMPLISNLSVTKGEVTYRDLGRDIDIRMKLDSIEGEEKRSQQKFSLNGEGTVQGQQAQITASGGSLNLLRNTNEPFPLKIEINIGKTRFMTDGTFTDPIQLKGIDARLELAGSNLADLFYLIHVPLPPTPTYSLKGQLQKDGELWTFSGFNGRVGASDLSGKVTYTAESERPELAGTLVSNKLDVKDLGGLVGLQPSQPKKVIKGQDVIPDMNINLKRLRAGDLDLTLDAKKLYAPGWPLNDMHTHIKLVNGLLRFKPLTFGVADGRVAGYIELNGRKNIPYIKTDLDLQRLSLKRFFKGSSFEEFSKGTFGGRIELAGTGRSSAEFLGNSNGRVVAVMSGGKISLKLIEAADLDIAQLMPLVLGKDKTTDIRCGVGDFAVRKGVLDSRVFVLDTTDTTIKGDAMINMKNENIDIEIDAKPKDVSIFSIQSKIKVTGKMSNPKVMIDPASALLRGAGAVLLGAIAPPAALLPFIEIGVGKNNDCSKLIGSTKKPLRPVLKDADVKKKVYTVNR